VVAPQRGKKVLGSVGVEGLHFLAHGSRVYSVQYFSVFHSQLGFVWKNVNGCAIFWLTRNFVK